MAEMVQRKDAMLRAAERLFAERGFRATSVRDIADELEIKAGSLYAHMESKDDLLWEIVNDAAERFFAAVKPVAESELVSLEKLRRVILGHINVITGNLAAAAIYSTEWRHLSEPRKTEFAGKRNAYEAIVRKLVRACIHEGVFAAVDEKFATLLILSSMNWIYQWYKTDGPMTPEEIARKLTDMLLNGLRRGVT